ELLNRVRDLARRVDTAELALVVGETQDALGPVVDAARGEADERGDRGCHAGDGVDGAGQFLDVDAGIGGRDRHSRSFRNQVALHRAATRVAARGLVTSAILIDARHKAGADTRLATRAVPPHDTAPQLGHASVQQTIFLIAGPCTR